MTGANVDTSLANMRSHIYLRHSHRLRHHPGPSSDRRVRNLTWNVNFRSRMKTERSHNGKRASRWAAHHGQATAWLGTVRVPNWSWRYLGFKRRNDDIQCFPW
jgi:hypothetical protein